MKGNLLRGGLLAVVVVTLLIGSETGALASGGPSVNGGGVVGGPLGVTSQLGLHATSTGGNFLCVMAGRSGKFPFGPWSSVMQMHVQGAVTPGTLTVTGSSSTFTGFASVHVVGKTATGQVLTQTYSNVPYTSSQGAG